MSEAGALARLWRYPVKSLLGESCGDALFNARGMAFDRAFAIRGADGKLGSGKNTRRMRQMEGLFRLRASLLNGKPAVTFEDGAMLACDDPGIHAALSRALHEPVTLVKESGWVGRTLHIGAQLRLRVIDTTERCQMVTLAQGDLPADARVLRTVARGLDAQFGVYAEVVAPGEARVGDPLRFA